MGKTTSERFSKQPKIPGQDSFSTRNNDFDDERLYENRETTINGASSAQSNEFMGVRNYERNHILGEISMNTLTNRDYSANA